MRTVIPSYLEFKTTGMISTSSDTVSFLPHVFLLLSQVSLGQITLRILPEFTPNVRMLEMHADKGDQPWEIFAWCVRDLLTKQSGLVKDNSHTSLQNKSAYKAFM